MPRQSRGLRIEDLLLAGWNAVGVPIVVAGGLAPAISLGDAPDPIAGIIQLGAVLGALVAVATRPTGSIPSAEPQLIASMRVDETGFGLFIVGMLVAALALFYASLVVAPRMLVDPEAFEGCLLWPLRFVLYLVSAALGIGWLTILGA